MSRALIFMVALLGSVHAPADHTPDPNEPAYESQLSPSMIHAKKFSGTTIVVLWEAGLQALEPIGTSGPLFEKLTGIRVFVVEADTDELFMAAANAHEGSTKAIDVLNVIPNQMPAMHHRKMLEPLDDYIKKYGGDFDDLVGAYKNNHMKIDGKTYGIPDDGDVLVLYYRKDLFEDAENQKSFYADHGYRLKPPKTWDEYKDIGTFFSRKYAPRLYGAVASREASHFHYLFQARFRQSGGRFFDKDMKAAINSSHALNVIEQIKDHHRFMAPNITDYSFLDALASFLSGKSAMLISWPPVGRWAEGLGRNAKGLEWLPTSKVKGKIGYAVVPGGRSELAVGFNLAVASNSKNKVPAYLFIQWLTSHSVSLDRGLQPNSLRDPYRHSHFDSGRYRRMWPAAELYLNVLKKSANNGYTDLALIGIDRYEDVLREATRKLWENKSPRDVLDEAAEKWDALTEAIGVERQKAVYEAWALQPNAY